MFIKRFVYYKLRKYFLILSNFIDIAWIDDLSVSFHVRGWEAWAEGVAHVALGKETGLMPAKPAKGVATAPLGE
ncbi:hypothetical protein [Cohaesibacter marisflavi]|nr:hypothetical protein [Cohaesibacter marisflavi]